MQVLPEVVQVGRLHHAGGHVAVLDALIGDDRRGEAATKIHLFQPLRVQLGDGIVAFPEGLQIVGGHALKNRFQTLCLLQKLR